MHAAVAVNHALFRIIGHAGRAGGVVGRHLGDQGQAITALDTQPADAGLLEGLLHDVLRAQGTADVEVAPAEFHLRLAHAGGVALVAEGDAVVRIGRLLGDLVEVDDLEELVAVRRLVPAAAVAVVRDLQPGRAGFLTKSI